MEFTQVRYQDPATQAYLGSPSLVRLPSGDLLATHDYFGPGAPLNAEHEEHLTSVYRSTDDGATWRNVTHIANAFWSSLLLHAGDVYLMGTSQQYGSIVIRRSEDGGNTWTHPTDADHGLLFRGGPRGEPPNYHCAPVPVLVANGRLWRAFEDCTPLEWGTGFQACVISASVDTDPLRANSWTMSNKLPFDRAWVPANWGNLDRPGWLEGNMVQAPNGELWNILRFNSAPLVDRAAFVKVSEDGTAISFDPQDGLLDFPGGMTKFTIRRDADTGVYVMLSNGNTDPTWPNQRNVLSLYVSRDLRSWHQVCELLRDDSDLAWDVSLRQVGFQYVDWQFDGSDIIYLVRTAYGGAHSYHDSNRITYHRLADWRRKLPGLGGNLD